MSQFPACKHKRHRAPSSQPQGLQWLASEPYRLFFFSGAVWSIIGVSLWPLFYSQHLGFYPSLVHARLMIEAFGGAFVVGFLGTAGPRMATAPKLTPLELIWLFGLHQAGAMCHLSLQQWWGDALFVLLLASLLLCLLVRVIRFRKVAPPPQMLLAMTGLACGIAGATMMLFPSTWLAASRLRLANLFLYQGLLLPPVLGIGSFVFPRMLGGEFGEPKTTKEGVAMLKRAISASILLVASFFMEATGHISSAFALRTFVAVGYLLAEVSWGRKQSGSLTSGMLWSLALGTLGLMLTPMNYAQHISIEHLLYIGGFGLLMFVVGSRVLFGHSGNLEGFFTRSKWVRFLVFLAVLAATTRATPAWFPSTTISHHIYAAWTWGMLSLLWLLWHRTRFRKRDETD